MSQPSVSEEQRIAVCKSHVANILTMLRDSPDDWLQHVTIGRSIIANLNVTSFMSNVSRAPEQVWVVDGLQRLAYQDPDSGGVHDIARWCSEQWLVLHQRDPQNVTALKGTQV